MVIGDDICIAVLGLVHLRVGILPCELLSRVNGLPKMEDTGRVRVKSTEAYLWYPLQSPATEWTHPKSRKWQTEDSNFYTRFLCQVQWLRMG